MSTTNNQSSPYKWGLILSVLLNIVLIVLLLSSRGSNGETAVSETTNSETSAVATVNDEPTEVAAEPTNTILPPPQTVAVVPVEPDPTATTAFTATPAATEEPTAVPTAPPPTATLPPTATVMPTAVPGPDWLRYYNLFRSQSGLPQIPENSAWSAASVAHSRYMMLNNATTHDENPSLQGYSATGNETGLNGNIAVSGWDGSSELWAIDYWMTAPFPCSSHAQSPLIRGWLWHLPRQ